MSVPTVLAQSQQNRADCRSVSANSSQEQLRRCVEAGAFGSPRQNCSNCIPPQFEHCYHKGPSITPLPPPVTHPASFMRVCHHARIVTLLLVLSALSGSVRADERADYFETHVRPLLIQHCVECHGPKKQESGLRLDSRDHVLRGSGDMDALVDRESPEDSRLLQVTAWSEDDVQMPPEERLPDEAIAILQRWIRDGAVWPESLEFGQATDATINWQDHWAFQPVTNPEPPRDGHPVDAFVQHRLSEAGVEPADSASARTLVRRLAVALTGLPPQQQDLEAAQRLSEQEVSAWLDDYTARLLASPQFGERWARFWLDVARYSDTKGYVFQEDRNYPDAWRYREWVINAFNQDMSWDEFLTRQLAADRFPDDQTPEQLAAMGFLTLGRRFLNNIHDIIDDRIDVTMRGMMGLTVSCARCHDHKYDPVPTADYYSLYGVFNSSEEPRNEPSPLRLVDRAKPREPVIFIRGSAGRKGDAVPRQFLTAFSGGEPQPFTDGSGRLELAQAIASRDNPLTARVAVNRIWSHLFSSPLVDSPSDFGTRSDPPAQPELLDHLATWFMDHNWSMKQLITYIVSSDTWRQSSARRPQLDVTDPDNRLLARRSPMRLDFEAHRDAILSVSGTLDLTMGGESVSITSKPFSKRRTVYASIDRQNLPGVFRAFDFASPDTHAPRRYETTVPQQALFQMNSPFVLRMAEASAKATEDSAAEADAAETPAADTTEQQLADRVVRMYRRILQRDPGADELASAVEFIRSDTPDIPGGWSYGYGEISEASDRLNSFQPLPSFHEAVWQGGTNLPDPVLNWTSLRPDGGHPGNSRALCAIRRWTASQAADIAATIRFEHNNEQGDGVVLLVLHNTDVVLVQEHIHNSKRRRSISDLKVAPGDTIDFVVFCGDNSSHDTFRCNFEVTEFSGDASRLWSSGADYSARSEPRVTDTWTQLAQVLMLTNEFVFVD